MDKTIGCMVKQILGCVLTMKTDTSQGDLIITAINEQTEVLCKKIEEQTETLMGQLVCEEVVGCIQMEAWDNDSGLLEAGETTFLEIKIDGVSQAVIPHDYTTTFDGVNKSTWYTPWLAAINALPEWTVTLVTDAGGVSPASGKPNWRIDYVGAGSSKLELCKSASAPAANGSNQEVLAITAAADGTLTGEAFNYGGIAPIPSPVFTPCPAAKEEAVKEEAVVAAERV